MPAIGTYGILKRYGNRSASIDGIYEKLVTTPYATLAAAAGAAQEMRLAAQAQRVSARQGIGAYPADAHIVVENVEGEIRPVAKSALDKVLATLGK